MTMYENEDGFLNRAMRGEVFNRVSFSAHTFEFGLPDGYRYKFFYTKGNETLMVCRSAVAYPSRVPNPYQKAEDLSYLLITDIPLKSESNEWAVRQFSYDEDSPIVGHIVHDNNAGSSLIINGETAGYVTTGILNRGTRGAVDLSKSPFSQIVEQEIHNNLKNMSSGAKHRIYRTLVLSAWAADLSQQASV